MTQLIDIIVDFNSRLKLLGVKFCLVGGMAITARSYERTTKDVDFAVSVISEVEAEECVRALATNGFEVNTILENKTHNVLSTVRLKYINGPEFFIDLLFSACGIEKEIVSQSSELELLPKVFVPVASVASLIVMKLVSFDVEKRPVDIADLHALLKVASDEDIRKVRELATLIVKRNFHRGRDLIAELEKLQLSILS